MFGYVRPDERELLVKDYEFYRATYCGICRSMKKHTGALSAVGLSFDSVFLALVRLAYADTCAFSAKKCRCAAHPFKKRCMLCESEPLAYTARAFAVLTLGKLRDDAKDEKFFKSLLRRLALPIFRRAEKRAKLPELSAFVRKKLDEIDLLEKQEVTSVDAPAALFGELLGAVFSEGLSGSAKTVASSLGDSLGRFIYAADAAEDYEKDRKSGSYNPYVLFYEGKDLTKENRETIYDALILTCKDMEKAVDLMPFDDRETLGRLIRNVIYRGLVKRVSFLVEPTEKQPKRRIRK